MKNVIKYGLLSLIVLVVPLFASAAFTTPPTPTLKSVKLQLFLNGALLTKGTLNVAKDTDAALKWTTIEGTEGCTNNWDDQKDSSGDSTGKFTESRYFIITCYGLGTAQTARLRVNVTYPDLTVQSFKIGGLTQFYVEGRAKKNTYKAGNPAYRIYANIRNDGGISAAASTVSFEYGKKGADGKIVVGGVRETKAVPALQKGGSLKIELPLAANAEAGTEYYFRAVADSAGVVSEGTKENNNSSRWIGPFIFE